MKLWTTGGQLGDVGAIGRVRAGIRASPALREQTGD